MAATASPPATTTGTATTVPISVPPLDHALSQGNAGSDVSKLQDRLRELAFDPGPSDGVFGPATKQAVWAFEKLILGTKPDAVTGRVTPKIWAAMNTPITIQARRASPTDTHLEVYLPEQVAVLFQAGIPRLITHISTGDGRDWCNEVTIDNDDATQTTKGICGTSITPGGVYKFQYKVAGWKSVALGRVYNPVFFNYGIAVHGATDVPDHPASHGCVRIPMHIAEYFSSLVERGDPVYVFDGVHEPEDYGAQPPVFDRPDPNYATTTTIAATTSTTVTTVSPAATSSTTPRTTTTTATTAAGSSTEPAPPSSPAVVPSTAAVTAPTTWSPG